MRFPPIALTKIVVYLLLTLVVLGLILLVFFKREPAPSLVKPKAEETTYRRGDDPTLYLGDGGDELPPPEVE